MISLNDIIPKINTEVMNVFVLEAERIEALIIDIKGWEKSRVDENDHAYPWEGVALSMLSYPEKVEFGHDKCPECGNERIKIFFCSPERTWAAMMGCAGDMVICPCCKRQA